MPSITYWSRLEPEPKSRDLSDSLAARVRDPLWMLARQWQLGERRGEDAGSPAFVELTCRFGRLGSWSAMGEDHPLDPDQPLEPEVLAEGIDPQDVALAAELGAAFERHLVAAGRGDLVDLFRSTYPIAMPSDEERHRDPAGSRVGSLLAGRRAHGIDLVRAAAAVSPSLPEPVPSDPSAEAIIRSGLEELRRWAGELGIREGGDSPAWHPRRLEYAFAARGHAPDGTPIVLGGQSRGERGLDWHSFDDLGHGDGERIESERVAVTTLPTNVTFRGMPSSRFWAFEHSGFNIDAVKPETRELGKLLVLDFLLLAGVDWYIVPVRLPLGALSEVESLVVHDVFGGHTSVAPVRSGSARWTAFTLTPRDGSEPRPCLFMPAVASSSVQRGEPLEEVRFTRDEMANIAWAIEQTIAGAAGEPLAAGQQLKDDPEPRPGTGSADLAIRYQIQTDVPSSWFPLVPVAEGPGGAEIALERAELQRSSQSSDTPEPQGRILDPTSGGDGYRLDEEALPRTGLLVRRVVQRARWTDGSTRVWIARRIRRGFGEEPSGLRYDIVDRGRQ